MGKKIIVLGADFSANGFNTANIVNIQLKSGETNPYKLYFLPTPLTYDSNVNTMPEAPNDAVLESIYSDGEYNIGGSNYLSFLFGRDSTDVDKKTVDYIGVNYDSQTIDDVNQSFMGIIAGTIDLRGVKFGTSVDARKMFAHSTFDNLLMPDMDIYGANYMFYNYCSEKTGIHADFSFIKKLGGDCQRMFNFLKCDTADFGAPDLTGGTDFMNLFRQSTMEEIDLSGWVFPNVRLGALFYGCSKLKTIHLDNWLVSADDGAKYASIFDGCTLLEKVFVTNCSAGAKTWLLTQLNTQTAGGVTNWTESTVDGKACLIHGS